MSDSEKVNRYTTKEFSNVTDSELLLEEQGVSTTTSHRKKALGGLSKVLGTMVIAVAIFVLSIISPTAVNVFAETVTPAAIGVYDGTVNPVEYYQTIEKSNLDKQIDAISNFYGLYLDNYKKTAEGVGAEVTIKAEIDPGITTPMGLKGLKSLKASIVSMQTDKKSQSIISLFTNDKQFTSLNVLSDTEKELVYILIPELSKAYLKVSANPNYGDLSETAAPFTTKEITELLNNNPLTEELLNQLLKKYTTIIVGEINDVDVANDNITAAGINADQTRITVKLDEKTLLTIAEKVLTAAKSDKDLLNLCVKFKICKESEFITTINEALNQVTYEKAKLSSSNSEEKILAMKVWVDKQGNITGRDFTYDLNSENSIIGYKIAKNGSDVGFEAWYTPDKKEALKLAGKVNTEGTGVTGDVNISYDNSNTQTSEVFNIKLEDVNYTFNDLSSYINGKFIITGDSLSGMSIVVDSTGNSKQQTMKLDFVQEETKLISVIIDSKILNYKEFKLPSESAKIYDAETQMEDYISNADFEKYLEGINKKIDVKGINTIIDQMIHGYSAY